VNTGNMNNGVVEVPKGKRSKSNAFHTSSWSSFSEQDLNEYNSATTAAGPKVFGGSMIEGVKQSNYFKLEPFP